MISKTYNHTRLPYGHPVSITPFYNHSHLLYHRLKQFAILLAENARHSIIENILGSVKFIMSYCPQTINVSTRPNIQLYQPYIHGVDSLGIFLSNIPLELHKNNDIIQISSFFLDCLCIIHSWIYDPIQSFDNMAFLVYQDNLEILLKSSLPFLILNESFMKCICNAIIHRINIDIHNAFVDRFIAFASDSRSISLIEFCISNIIEICTEREQFQYPLPLSSCILYLSKQENVTFTPLVLNCLSDLAFECSIDICDYFNEPEIEDEQFSLGFMYVSTISCLLSNIDDEYLDKISNSTRDIILCIFNTVHVISDSIIEFVNSLLEAFFSHSLSISLNHLPSSRLSFYDYGTQKRFYKAISKYLDPDLSSVPSEDQWSEIHQYAYFLIFKEKDDSICIAFIQHHCRLLMQQDDPDKLGLILELLNDRLEIHIETMNEIDKDAMTTYTSLVKLICSSIYQQLFIHSSLNMTFIRRQIITCFYKFIKFNIESFPEYISFHEHLVNFYISFIVQFILPSVKDVQDISSIPFAMLNLSINYFLSLANHINLDISSIYHSLFNANSAYASLLYVLWSRIFSITKDLKIILQKPEWILFLEPLARFTPPLLHQKDHSIHDIVQYILTRQWKMNAHPSHLGIYLAYWNNIEHPSWIGASMTSELIQCSGSYLQQVFISMLPLLSFIINKELAESIYQIMSNTKSSTTWWIDRSVLNSWISCIKVSRTLANLPTCNSISTTVHGLFKICSSDNQEERKSKHSILVSLFKDILGIIWNEMPTFCINWLFIEADWTDSNQQDIMFLTSDIVTKVSVPLILESLTESKKLSLTDFGVEYNDALIKQWIELLRLELESPLFNELEVVYNYVNFCRLISSLEAHNKNLIPQLSILGNMIMYLARKYSKTTMLAYRIWILVVRYCYLCKISYPSNLSFPYDRDGLDSNISRDFYISLLYLRDQDMESDVDLPSQSRIFPSFSHISFPSLLDKYIPISVHILNKVADLCNSSDIMQSMIIPDPYRKDATTFIIYNNLESSMTSILDEKPFSMIYCKPNWIVQIANIMMQNSNQVSRFRSNIFWRTCQFQPSSIISMRLLRHSSSSVYKYGIHSLLTSCSSDHVLYYVPQIVQLILHNDKALIPLLILKLAEKDRRFAHLVIWNMQANLIVEKNAPILNQCIKHILGSMDEQDKEFCDREFKFFSSITRISGLLKPYLKHSKAEKKAFLDEELSKIIVDSGVYLPSSPEYMVTGIDYQTGGRPLQSHAKTPFMATFFVKDDAGYELSKSVIFKVGDDCRQDMLALQLIERFQKIFRLKGLELFLYPYRVVATAPGCGVIEVIPNAISRDQLGREKINRLTDYFVYKYGPEHSEKFHRVSSNS